MIKMLVRLLGFIVAAIILAPFPTIVYALTCGTGKSITLTEICGGRYCGNLAAIPTSIFAGPRDWNKASSNTEERGGRSGAALGNAGYAAVGGECCNEINCFSLDLGSGARPIVPTNGGASTNLSDTLPSSSQQFLATSISRVGEVDHSDIFLTVSTTYANTKTEIKKSTYDAWGNNPMQTSSARAKTRVNCNIDATVANFAGQVALATPGQAICLASGDYGTWMGTNKAVIITKQSGATVTMGIDFITGKSGFTIDNLTITGGRVSGGANNITIKNSAFTGNLIIDGVANANILLDNNTHVNINSCKSGCVPAAIHLPYSSNTFSGVTVQNSLFKGGNADGIQAGTGLNILHNRFIDIGEHGNNALHTDPIQLTGARGAVVRGNYLYNTSDGIVAYDGLDSATIEDNVIDLVRGRWGIELYADKNSIVRHNTLKYGTRCEYAACGQILLDHKPADPPGTGTVIENNIASGIAMSNGSTAAVNRNNMLVSSASGDNFSGVPTYVGGTHPNTYPGYALAAGSQGKGAASDGLDVGIRVIGAKRR